MSHRANLVKLIRQNGYRHDTWQIFADFVEMSAISLSNAVDLAQRERREARYMEIVGRYTKEEAMRFSEMLGELVMALETEPSDVLGAVFMELELGNKWHGQFFTPYSVCKAMAAMLLGDGDREQIKRRGFLRANEPACGGGAMIIALAEAMKAEGINYQQHLHVVAQDLDPKAVHMAYVQLSLMHIPAIVILGNTLALEEREHWYTPAHIMGGWTWRLRAADRRDAVNAQLSEVEIPVSETGHQNEAPAAPDHIEEPFGMVAVAPKQQATQQMSLF